MSTWDDKPNDYEHALQIIERLRAALYDAREFVEHMFERDGGEWAKDRLAKIDAALGINQQTAQKKP